jgi:hypothetical protein
MNILTEPPHITMKISEISRSLPSVTDDDLPYKDTMVLHSGYDPHSHQFFPHPKVTNVQPQIWIYRSFLADALVNSLQVTYGDERPWIAYSDPQGKHVITIEHQQGRLIYQLVGFSVARWSFLARWPD